MALITTLEFAKTCKYLILFDQGQSNKWNQFKFKRIEAFIPGMLSYLVRADPLKSH